ncbi:hypothetical protein [Acinetobacter phage Ab69]|nr:hypothetical protein [Acinetobacter phage Ab69]
MFSSSKSYNDFFQNIIHIRCIYTKKSNDFTNFC